MSNDRKCNEKEAARAVQKIRELAGSHPKMCINPGLTKRELIAIADHIASLESKIKVYMSII